MYLNNILENLKVSTNVAQPRPNLISPPNLSDLINTIPMYLTPPQGAPCIYTGLCAHACTLCLPVSNVSKIVYVYIKINKNLNEKISKK